MILAAVLAAVVGVWALWAHGPARETSGARTEAAFGAAPGQAAGTCAGRPVTAPRELRGMWITTVNNIDWPSRPGLPVEQVKAEYRGWLDLARERNLNAVFVHVRPSGDALWPSQRAPWSEWLTGSRDGRDPGWDPMAWMVAETHARNLEFHAWFNPYRGGQPGPAGPGGDLAKLAPNHPLRAHPEWAVIYPKAGTTGSRPYYNPGIPAARRFVEDAMLEAVERYDIDGVHFDDFFYPYPVAGQDFPDAAAFTRYGKGFTSRAAWRRENVNTLVREMNERIKAVKPWVKFGISPFGIWRNRGTDPAGSASSGLQSYDAIYADTRRWVREQWLDYVVPQLYWQIGFAKADYAKMLPWWAALVKGTRVQLYIGQADYRIGEAGAWRDPAQLERQLTLNRRYGVAGSVHFSAKQVRADRLGAVSRYAAKHYSGPALPPVMAHLPTNEPATPRVAGGATLTWQPATDATSYAVYRVEGAMARLVDTTRATSWRDPAPTAGATTYCVAGLDRGANEGGMSEPISVLASR